MKCYLAGPMTGIPEFNFDTFEESAKQLREVGFVIASPHEIDHGETLATRGSKPYTTYLRAGLKLLLTCDVIILMFGWEHSQGCLTELYVAHACGLRVMFWDPVTKRLTSSVEEGL